jgi:peptidase E
MPQANVIRWREGAGWIVLSGGGDEDATSEIDSWALTRIRRGEPLAYIWAASDEEAADAHLDMLEEAGAPTGYLVDVLTEDDDTIRELLRDAGIIVIGDGAAQKRLRSGLMGAALEAMGEAHERGAVILCAGRSAGLFGAYTASSETGMDWIENAIVVPYYEGGELREPLVQHPESIGLGIGAGTALALGPEGQVEVWGGHRVTIILGSQAG